MLNKCDHASTVFYFGFGGTAVLAKKWVRTKSDQLMKGLHGWMLHMYRSCTVTLPCGTPHACVWVSSNLIKEWQLHLIEPYKGRDSEADISQSVVLLVTKRINHPTLLVRTLILYLGKWWWRTIKLQTNHSPQRTNHWHWWPPFCL